MGMDDVVRALAQSRTQLPGCADVCRATAAAIEGEHLDVVAERAQVVHLVAHEDAEGGLLRRREHVRHDEDAQRLGHAALRARPWRPSSARKNSTCRSTMRSAV